MGKKEWTFDSTGVMVVESDANGHMDWVELDELYGKSIEDLMKKYILKQGAFSPTNVRIKARKGALLISSNKDQEEE